MAVVTDPDWSRYDIITVVVAATSGNPGALADLKRRAEAGDSDAQMALTDIETARS